jgi:hypothetical protein
VASRLVVALGLAATVALLPGCFLGSSDRVAIELPTEPPTGSSAEFLAEIGGELVFDEATDCVLLRSGHASHLVVWPTGTTAIKNPFELRLPDGSVAHEGDRIEGGGGYFTRSELEEVAGELGSRSVIPSAACPHQGEIAAMNANGDVTVVEQDR